MFDTGADANTYRNNSGRANAGPAAACAPGIGSVLSTDEGCDQGNQNWTSGDNLLPVGP